MGLPVVVAGPYQETVPLSYVAPNDYLGAYLATRHLIELGHSKVGLLAHRQVSRVSAERRAGWQMACAIDNDAVVKLSYHAGKAAIGGGLVFAEVKAELLAQFKQRPPPPGAFCA
jgi:LacI family transcriptional regulator